MPMNSSEQGLRRVIAGILIAGSAVCALLCWSALHVNGAFGFPLDDSWIHLQFARTLREYGSFSYYQNQMVTSGSTSPLYTMLLAAGQFIISNEFTLSYSLGIAFFIAGAFVLSRIGEKIFNGQPVLLVGCVLLYLLEPRLQWIALSGMETTLFILLLLLVWYFYRLRSARLLGMSAGLLLWTRPEAVIFYAVIALDAVYHVWWVRRERVRKGSHLVAQMDYRWLLTALGIAGIICAGYAAFNLALSGSFLPNTYAAKIQYYSSGRGDFSLATFRFLTGGHMPVLAAFAAIAVLDVLWKAVRRERQEYFVPVLWCAGLYAAYAQTLPFLYQEGRYLMPMLPWIILLGMRGMEIAITLAKNVLKMLHRRAVSTVVLSGAALLLLVQFGIGAWATRGEYGEQCRYISDRQVRTANWIRDHLPAGAVIGTHDVGAIAYYSGRRIVDMVGLVSPETIKNIGSFDRLIAFLGRNRVTHLAVLRNWFEVANQRPSFQTDERAPEIMEVFPFDPAQCHFTPQNAGTLIAGGSYLLGLGQVQRAGPMMEEAVRIDPHSARAHYYLGVAFLTVGKNDEAEREITTALGLQPESWQAMLARAHLFMLRNDPDRALEVYTEVERMDPTYAPVFQALSHFYFTVKKDTAAGQEYLKRYSSLAGESAQRTLR